MFLCVQDAVVARLKDVVDDFKELLPLVDELGNTALQQRHWQQIFELIGADIAPADDGGPGEHVTFFSFTLFVCLLSLVLCGTSGFSATSNFYCLHVPFSSRQAFPHSVYVSSSSMTYLNIYQRCSLSVQVRARRPHWKRRW